MPCVLINTTQFLRPRKYHNAQPTIVEIENPRAGNGPAETSGPSLGQA